MSGLVKGIKKVFKKITNFVKKYWKYIVIAVAVYFTAGVALSYFGGTAGFASAMPGFGTGGLFSKAAVAMGFKGSATVASGLSMTSGAWAGSAAAAYGSTMTAAELAAAQAVSSGAATYGTGTAAGTLAPVKVTATKVGAGQTIAGSQGALTGAQATQAAAAAAETAAGVGAAGQTTAGALTATDAAMKAMSGAMKMQTAATLLKTAGGLFSESQDDINRKQHARENAQAFGVGRDGSKQYGWYSGEAIPAGPGGSAYAPTTQNMFSSPQGGGSLYAAQGGSQNFLQAPTGGTSAGGAAPQGDFIVKPQPAGGNNG